MVIPVVLVMGLVGILGSAEAQTRVYVSASAKTLGTSPFFAAAQQGFLEAEGLKVQMVYMRGAAPAVQALVGGSVQFSTGGVDAILEAADRGLPLAVIGARAPAWHSAGCWRPTGCSTGRTTGC
ncbi:MAG: ABC transporter substrate-binding protein [Deltaproteobacteria bacterium]|nr:ABC transporter substrate-binding protein [Deltaproteobacteria bacterium]